MSPSVFFRIMRAGVVLALLSLTTGSAWATSAPFYSSQASAYRTCTGLGLATICYGSVENEANAADANLTNYAVLHTPLLLFPVALRMSMPQVVPANYRAGVVIGSTTGLSAIGAVVVRTYLRNANGTSQFREERVVTGLAQAVLGTTTPGRVEFVATQSFDQVEIEVGAVLNVGYDVNVYYAYGIDANVVTTATGYVSRFGSTGSSTYSTAVQTNGITVCANTNISNPTNAVDTDLNNYASFGTLASVNCPTTLQVQLEGQAPAGYQAGFVIGNGGLLDVNALSGLQLTTYLNGVAQETAAAGQLLQLKLLPGGKYAVSFESTKPFDRVEIRRNSLLSVLDNLRLYYGFGVEPRAFRDQEPVLSNFPNPTNQYQTNGALVCLNCSIDNPQHAADADLKNNYAQINSLVAVGGSTRLKLRLNGSGKAGNTAGVVLSAAAGLLDAQLLSSIQVRTYSGPMTGSASDGSRLVETASGSSLLNLELLSDGRQEVSFLTTQDFDWVELEVSNGISLLNALRVYYGFAEDRPTGFPTEILAPAPLPVELVRFGAKVVGEGVDVSWQTATETTSSYFVVERSVSREQGFAAIGRVAAAGTSTRYHNYSLRDDDVSRLSATTLYYRLRQVDTDGKEQYSTVVPVQWNTADLTLAVYPNPARASEAIRVQLVGSVTEGSVLAVYDAQARLLSRQPLTGLVADLSAARLPAGLYQVVLLNTAGQKLASQRLVVAAR